MIMIVTVKPKCGKCGTPLAGIEAGDQMTAIVHRTCRKCRRRWFIIVRPGRRRVIADREAWIHLAELTLA